MRPLEAVTDFVILVSDVSRCHVLGGRFICGHKLSRRLIELFGVLAPSVAASRPSALAQPVELVVEGGHLVLVPFFVNRGLVLVVDPLVGLQIVPQMTDVLHDVRLHHVRVFNHNPWTNLQKS